MSNGDRSYPEDSHAKPCNVLLRVKLTAMHIGQPVQGGN